jgi:hypothetical protein
MSETDPIRSYRNRLLDEASATSGLEAVLAFGSAAHHAVTNWPGRGALPAFNLRHPTAEEVTDNWNLTLHDLQDAIQPEPGNEVDPVLYGQDFAAADITAIPRLDLPFGVPAWHGTGGNTHSKRQSAKEIVWNAGP